MEIRGFEFTSHDVAAVTGVNLGTLKTWTARKQLLVDAGPGTGRSRKYDFGTVVHIAIVGRLVDLGFAVKSASAVAMHALHAFKYGRGDFLIVGPPRQRPPNVAPSKVPTIDVVKCDNLAELATIMDGIPHGPPDTFTIVDLTAVSANIETALGERMARPEHLRLLEKRRAERVKERKAAE